MPWIYSKAEHRIVQSQRALRAALNPMANAVILFRTKNIDLDAPSWTNLKDHLNN